MAELISSTRYVTKFQNMILDERRHFIGDFRELIHEREKQFLYIATCFFLLHIYLR